MRLSAVDLGGEKHALLETGGGSIRQSCDEVLATLVAKASFEKHLEGVTVVARRDRALATSDV